jgi:hypothetical protein
MSGIAKPAKTVTAHVKPAANISTYVKAEAKETLDIFFVQ